MRPLLSTFWVCSPVNRAAKKLALCPVPQKIPLDVKTAGIELLPLLKPAVLCPVRASSKRVRHLGGCLLAYASDLVVLVSARPV